MVTGDYHFVAVKDQGPVRLYFSICFMSKKCYLGNLDLK